MEITQLQGEKARPPSGLQGFPQPDLSLMSEERACPPEHEASHCRKVDARHLWLRPALAKPLFLPSSFYPHRKYQLTYAGSQ